MSDFRIVFNHKIVDYKILSFHSVFAHIELEKFLDSILSLSFTLSRRMSGPMNSANSASFISPRPLNRVISALLPNLAIAASPLHRYSNRTYLSLLRFPLSCGFSFGASHGILVADAEKRSLKNIYMPFLHKIGEEHIRKKVMISRRMCIPSTSASVAIMTLLYLSPSIPLRY